MWTLIRLSLLWDIILWLENLYPSTGLPLFHIWYSTKSSLWNEVNLVFHDFRRFAASFWSGSLTLPTAWAFGRSPTPTLAGTYSELPTGKQLSIYRLVGPNWENFDFLLAAACGSLRQLNIRAQSFERLKSLHIQTCEYKCFLTSLVVTSEVKFKLVRVLLSGMNLTTKVNTSYLKKTFIHKFENTKLWTVHRIDDRFCD